MLSHNGDGNFRRLFPQAREAIKLIKKERTKGYKVDFENFWVAEKKPLRESEDGRQ